MTIFDCLVTFLLLRDIPQIPIQDLCVNKKYKGWILIKINLPDTIEICTITTHFNPTYPVLRLILLVYLGNWPYIQGRWIWRSQKRNWLASLPKRLPGNPWRNEYNVLWIYVYDDHVLWIMLNYNCFIPIAIIVKLIVTCICQVYTKSSTNRIKDLNCSIDPNFCF